MITPENEDTVRFLTMWLAITLIALALVALAITSFVLYDQRIRAALERGYIIDRIVTESYSPPSK